MKRAMLEDARPVSAAVRRVQEELDDAQYVHEFEEAVGEMGRGLDDPIFSDRVALYTWGELQYKSTTTRSILPNPSHRCSRDQNCHMRRLDVRVLRRFIPCPQGAQPPADSSRLSGYFVARALRDEGQARLYHLCIGGMCEHMVRGHACRMSPQCWHATPDRHEDTLVLEDFWVCETTGNLHVCGEMCAQPKDITEHERDLVCTLTGQIIVGRRPVTEMDAAAEQRDPRALALTGRPDAGPIEDTEGARQRRQVAVARGGRRARVAPPTWGPSGEEAEYRLFAQHMVTELLFSATRQMLEANIYLCEYKRALDEVNKFMRVRKLVDDMPPTTAAMIRMVLDAQAYVLAQRPLAPGETVLRHDPKCAPLIMAGQALCVFRSREPVSEYFANIPMMDSVAHYVARRRLEIEAEHLETDRRQPSDVNALRQYQFYQQERVDAVHAAHCDFERYLSRVVSEYRLRHGIVRPEPTRWDSPQWQRRMENITLLFAHTLVRVWRGLNQHATTPTARQTLAFGRIALGVLYLTKSSLEVQDLQITSCASFVTIVPRIDFARLLPCDNQLDIFNLDQFVLSPTARRLTTTQGDVRQEAMRISRIGALPSLLLRLGDVSADLAAETKATQAAQPPVLIPVGK